MKAWIGKISLAAATIFITLGLAEVGLRFVDFPPAETPHQRLFVEYDPTRGWKNIPNTAGRYTTAEYSVYLKYNSHGIRGPERGYAKPAGTFRIVVVGDSFVEGYSVEEDERVTEVLERSLSAVMARPVEVIGLGTGGYSNDQEMLWLESEGLRYQPDLVILLFYYNDIWFNDQSIYWRGEKPKFVQREDSLVLTNVPVPSDAFDKSRSTVLASDPDAGLAGLKISKLVSRAAQNPYWQGVTAGLGLVRLPLEQTSITPYGIPVPSELTVYQKYASPEIDHAWKTTRALLAQMKMDSEMSGANFLIFYVPSKLDVYPNHWQGFETNYGITEENWDSHQVARDLKEVCQKIAAECIDPTNQFIDTQAKLDASAIRLYHNTDEHWTANGHHLGGSILGDYVVNQLPSSR